MESFRKLGLSSGILHSIVESGFTEPSDIQEKAIPFVLQGKDVLGSSATGSGKTLVFGVGIIEGVEHEKGIQALILTPTRELAEQVAKILRYFSRYKNLNVCDIYGGVSINPQIQALRYADIVVGTPGRVLDHLSQKNFFLDKVNYLVLDEADRMLDMGFIDDVVKIINKCPKKRQTLLFSATISADIEHIAKRYMSNPVFVEAETQVDPSKLHQVFYDIQDNMKFSLLVSLLKKESSGLVMVFCNTRRNVDYLSHNLKKQNIDARAIHGGLAQSKRTRVLQDFHAGHALVLVCTDVAARGLDIKGVSHIYNYDVPKTTTEYLHRIGRTARAGKDGIAVSLVSSRDYDNFRGVCDRGNFVIEQKEVLELEKLSVQFNQHQKRHASFNKSHGFFARKKSKFSRGFRSSRRYDSRAGDGSRGFRSGRIDNSGGFKSDRRDGPRSFRDSDRNKKRNFKNNFHSYRRNYRR